MHENFASAQQQANKALHPTASVPLVPRSTPAAGELGSSVAARGIESRDTLDSMKKPIAIASTLVLLLIAAFLGGRSFLHNTPGHVFFRQYNQLKPGMTHGQVQGIFGRAPDYVCRFSGGQIIYYSRGHITDRKPDPKLLPASVNVASQIPYVYGSGQFLFTSKGLLSAFTVCG
jgi:hypothetical protein